MLSVLITVVVLISTAAAVYALNKVQNVSAGQAIFSESELPGGGLKLPKNERLHLSTDQKWIEEEGHLSDLIRLQWLGDRAKPAVVWVDENGKDKAAIIAHDKANNPESPDHKHLSFETTMSLDGENADELFTRLEIPFDEDVSEINTHSSNFTVRSGTLRVTGEEGQNKDVRLQLENDTKTGLNRWAIRGDAAQETGNNTGTDFHIVRFDDDGEAIDSPLFIKRSSGYIGINNVNPERRLDIDDNRIRVRDSYTPPSSDSECLQGDIAWDDEYLYVCIADNKWTRAALSTW